MKKLIVVLLAMSVLLSFAACGEGNKVTIYVPDTMTITSPDGGQSAAAKYVFEEGWETKESFSVNLEVTGLEGVEENVSMMTMVYSERTLVTEQVGGVRITTVFNEKGQTVSTTTENTRGETSVTMETTSTYDARGRKLTDQTKTSYGDQAEPVTTSVTYTYTDTDTGSEGRSEAGSMVSVLTYDKNDRLVCTSQILNGEEMSRTENTFNEAGNLICSKSYFEGKLVSTTETTFRTVEVSRETADRLPNFKRGN